MGQPVVHFEVVGKDVEKLKSFYSELAGWSYDSPPGGDQEGVPPYALVPRDGNTNPDGVGIGGGIGAGPEGYPGHVTFYIEVPDVGASLDQVEKLGGTKVMGPESMGEGLVIGLFTDPEGHTVGLVQSQS
ncbi:MAG: VOC family protein [Solirubrobacterales bacterium]|nr:VOC family protein [Solirubrobacterales bacterium]